MDEKIARLTSWMNDNGEMPFTLEINPTNRCNLQCSYCWQQNFENIDKEDKISKEKMLEIIKEASELGVREIRIPGSGEPLLRNELLEIMQEIKHNNINGLLITNGLLLDEQKINQVIDMQWDCITFSFDSTDKKVNDFFRREGSFEKLRENLLLLQKLKSKKSSSKPLIRFNVVITNKNYKTLSDIIAFAKKVSCEDVEFQPLTVWSKVAEKYKLNRLQRFLLSRKIPEIKALADSYGIYTNISDLNSNVIAKAAGDMDKLMNTKEKNSFLSLPCFEPWYNMVILPEGKVNACSMAGSSFGANILNKSLKEIWKGDYFTKLRQDLLKKELPVYCKKCCAVVFVENKKIKEALKKKAKNGKVNSERKD